MRVSHSVAATSRRRARDVHRIRHTIDLLVERVPARVSERFRAQPRFAIARELEVRAARTRSGPESTARMVERGGFEEMVGASEPMLELFRSIELLAEHELAVVVTGPTGSGKELVARALHRRGVRRDRPFLSLHCASLPAELFEAELFGVVEGAFTGAENDRAGVLATLDQGTLFLDEITELPLAVQGKLVRFLDSGRVRPLGGVTERAVDVRVIASSTVELQNAVDDGSFRRDLQTRLGSAILRVPGLRQRSGDLAPLAVHFLREHARRFDRPPPALAASALEVLEQHSWPGNVRELETVLVRALIASPEAERIDGASVEAQIDRGSAPATLVSPRLLEAESLDALKTRLEREYLTQLFLRTGGDAKEMMATLGVKRSQLYAWFRKLDVDVRELRRDLDDGSN